MSYQVRNRRNDDGSYTLSYGKGQKKLTCSMQETPQGWACVEGAMNASLKPQKTMKACKQAWGEWAASQYDGQTSAPAAPPPPAARSEHWEKDEDRQRLIDDAPDAETAEHRYQIAVNTEEMVRHEHELEGRAYTPYNFRRRIPRRHKMETV